MRRGPLQQLRVVLRLPPDCLPSSSQHQPTLLQHSRGSPACAPCDLHFLHILCLQPNAETQFLEVKNAFTVLSDRQQRADYDRKLRGVSVACGCCMTAAPTGLHVCMRLQPLWVAATQVQQALHASTTVSLGCAVS